MNTARTTFLSDSRWPRAAAALALALALGACDTLRDTLGLGKEAPDEFTVVTSAPLILPPDYSLRPPDPGARRPDDLRPAQEARTALTGGEQKAEQDPRPWMRNSGSGAGAGSASVGEAALLKQAGAADIDPSIRGQIERESNVLAGNDKGLAERLLFWQQSETSTVVDAPAEAERLRRNADTGAPVTSGPTPTTQQGQQQQQ